MNSGNFTTGFPDDLDLSPRPPMVGDGLIDRSIFNAIIQGRDDDVTTLTPNTPQDE